MRFTLSLWLLGALVWLWPLVNGTTSFYVVDQSSIPVKLPSGVIDQHNTTTYQVNMMGAEGGVRINELIATPTGTEFLIQITVRPLIIPMKMAIPYVVPAQTMLNMQHVGTSQFASLGSNAPESLTGPQKYAPSTTFETPGYGRRLLQQNGQTFPVFTDPSPSTNRFGANVYNPPGFIDLLDGSECNLAIQIILSIVGPGNYPYPHPGVGILDPPNGFTSAGYLCGTPSATNDQPNPTAGPVTATTCHSTVTGVTYDSFGVPCTASLTTTQHGASALQDPHVMTCIAGMWKQWKAQLLQYGACETWVSTRASLLPNVAKWCDVGQGTNPSNPNNWVNAALWFKYGNPTDNQNPTGYPWVQITFGASGPTCNLPETTYPTTPLQVYAPPITDSTNVNSLCSIDPTKYTTFANAFTAQSSRSCTANDVAHSATSGCTQIGQLVTPFNPSGNFVGGLDINPPNADMIFPYYDSPDCPCMPSDNPFYYTCPTNPWVTDIDYTALSSTALSPGSLFYRVGTPQKCTPLQLNTGLGWANPGNPINGGTGPQIAARNGALAQGGYCVPFISDAIAFDYSTEVSETFRPPFPNGCWSYVAELIAVDVAVLIVAGPAYAGAIVAYCILAHLPFASLPGCDCPVVTVTAGTFQANRENQKAAIVTTQTTLQRQTSGLLTQNANVIGNLTQSTVPALLNAANALNNEAIVAQVTAATINQQEVLVQTGNILLNQSISQLASANNQLIQQQTNFVSGINLALNQTLAQMQLIATSAIGFYNFSIQTIQHQMNLTQNGIQQFMLLAKNDQLATQVLHEVIAVMNKEVIQLDVYQRMQDDILDSLPQVQAQYGLYPLLSDCNANYTICGTPRTGVPLNQTIAIDSLWNYGLEWQSGVGDSPSAPNLNTQVPRIHQWNYQLWCNISVLLNYFNVTLDIQQMRDMIQPSSCYIQTTHTSCLSTTVMGTLVSNYILPSNGNPAVFGLTTLMNPGGDGAVHRCVSNSFIVHEQNQSQWAYQWDVSHTTECTYPNMITSSGLWPGWYVVRGGTFGLKFQVPYVPASCLLDDFSRALYYTQLGTNTLPSMNFALFDTMFLMTIGSQSMLNLYVQTQIGSLPRYGLEQTYYPIQQPYNTTLFQNAPKPTNQNYSAILGLLYQQSQNQSFFDQALAALQGAQNYGFQKSMNYDHLLMNGDAIPAILVTPNDTIVPDVFIQMAPVNNTFSLDFSNADLNFFTNQTFASLGAVLDETKLFSTFANQQMWYFYPSWIYDLRGNPSVFNLNTPQSRQSFIYDIDPNDVTPWARTWLLSEGKLDYIRRSIGVELFEKIINGSIALQLQQAPWVTNVTVIPPWGQSLLKHLNYSGQSHATIIPFNPDIEMLLFNEAFNRQIAITDATLDLLDLLVEWSPRLASVSLHEHLSYMSCTDFIPAAPFNDWIKIRCTCLKPPELFKQTCTIMQNFLFTAPVSWLATQGGESADAWTTFYLQPYNQTVQVQTILPASVVLGVAAAPSPCPSNIGQNTTDFTFQRPNFGQSVNLVFNFTLVSIHFTNETGTTQADCQSFMIGTLGPQGWSYFYDTLHNTYNASIIINYPASISLTDIQTLQALPIPLSTSSCQLLAVQMTRLNPYTFCGLWESTGIPSGPSSFASSSAQGYAVAANIVQETQFVEGWDSQTQLSDISASLQDLLVNVLGPVDVNANVLQYFVTPNQFGDLLGNLPSSSLENFIGPNGTVLANASSIANTTGGQPGLYPLGNVYVVNATAAQGVFVTLFPPANNSLNNQVSQTGAQASQTLATNFNTTWSIQNPSQLGTGVGAQTTADQLAAQLQAQVSAAANVSITPSALAAFLSAIKSSIVFNTLQPFIDSFNAQQVQLNYTAAVRNALADPVFQDAQNLTCLNDIAIQQQQDPTWTPGLFSAVQARYGYQVGMTDLQKGDHTVTGNPFSWGNNLDDDSKQALWWFMTLIVVVLIVFGLAVCGMFIPGIQDGSCCACYWMSNLGYEVFGPGKFFGCNANPDAKPPAKLYAETYRKKIARSRLTETEPVKFTPESGSHGHLEPTVHSPLLESHEAPHT